METMANSVAPKPPPRSSKPSLGEVPPSYYGTDEVLQSLGAMDISGTTWKVPRSFNQIHQTLEKLDRIKRRKNESKETKEDLAAVREEEGMDSKKQQPFRHPLIDQKPETVIGEGVEIIGDLEYRKLLRIDGTFKGKLFSDGDLVVGCKGSHHGDIVNLRTIVIDGGIVRGNIVVDSVYILQNSSIHGNITCKSMTVLGDDVMIDGQVNINPFAPEMIDENGDIIIVVNEGNEDHEDNEEENGSHKSQSLQETRISMPKFPMESNFNTVQLNDWGHSTRTPHYSKSGPMLTIAETISPIPLVLPEASVSSPLPRIKEDSHSHNKEKEKRKAEIRKKRQDQAKLIEEREAEDSKQREFRIKGKRFS